MMVRDRVSALPTVADRRPPGTDCYVRLVIRRTAQYMCRLLPTRSLCQPLSVGNDVVHYTTACRVYCRSLGLLDTAAGRLARLWSENIDSQQ